MKITYRVGDCTATEPVVGLGWDFHTEGSLSWGVFAFGTKAQIEALKHSKLPSYEEVVEQEKSQRRATP